jgi:hypothetical protein
VAGRVPPRPARPPARPQGQAPGKPVVLTPSAWEFARPALEIWPAIPDIVDRVRRFKRNLLDVMRYINQQAWNVFEYPQVQRMLGEIERELEEFMLHGVVKSQYTYDQLVGGLREAIRERNAAKALFVIAQILLSLPPQPRW